MSRTRIIPLRKTPICSVLHGFTNQQETSKEIYSTYDYLNLSSKMQHLFLVVMLAIVSRLLSIITITITYNHHHLLYLKFLQSPWYQSLFTIEIATPHLCPSNLRQVLPSRQWSEGPASGPWRTDPMLQFQAWFRFQDVPRQSFSKCRWTHCCCTKGGSG